MPTAYTMLLPPPTSWNEFESIVKTALELKWNSSNIVSHGRQGQSQNGVDLYGSDDFGRTVGIQCKCTTAPLTKVVIDNEIAKAETLTPAIDCFLIATSAQTDKSIQRYIREQSDKRKATGKFPLSIMYWTDIIQTLASDTNALSSHYPNYFQGQPLINQHLPQPSATQLRTKDAHTFNELLSYVDVISLHSVIEMAPKRFHDSFVIQYDTLASIVSNPCFFIHDKAARESLFAWLGKWREIMRIGVSYYSHFGDTDYLDFEYMEMDRCITTDADEAYKKLEVAFIEYKELFGNCMHLIQSQYPEIDLSERSAVARQR